MQYAMYASKNSISTKNFFLNHIAEIGFVYLFLTYFNCFKYKKTTYSKSLAAYNSVDLTNAL